MKTTCLPLSAKSIMSRISRRVFMRQFSSIALGAASSSRLSAGPATRSPATANAADTVGAARPLGLEVLPDPVWLERIRGSQRLNFDLGIRNHDSVQWELTFIGLPRLS